MVYLRSLREDEGPWVLYLPRSTGMTRAEVDAFIAGILGGESRFEPDVSGGFHEPHPEPIELTAIRPDDGQGPLPPVVAPFWKPRFSQHDLGR